jgi:CheY-like chemotaxis protein
MEANRLLRSSRVRTGRNHGGAAEALSFVPAHCIIKTPDCTVGSYSGSRDQGVQLTTAGDATTSVTVLLVDDEPALRELLVEVLTDSGYRVLEAASGSEALAMTSTSDAAIDILVTDVRMPGIDGPELAASARTVVPKLKVLYMSGYTDHHLFHENLTGAEANFIQKPFAAEDLCARIEALVRT